MPELLVAESLESPRPIASQAATPFERADCGPEGWQGWAQRLLHQQLWCFGCDIGSPWGNLLVRLGLERKAAAERDVSSIYYQSPTPTSRIVLRGFGVFFGDDRWGGLFIERYQFAPRFTPAATLAAWPWLLQDLPERASPSAVDGPRLRRLVQSLALWLADYETRQQSEIGAAHRAAAVAVWGEKEPLACAAGQMAGAWRQVAAAVEGPLDWLTRAPPPASTAWRAQAERWLFTLAGFARMSRESPAGEASSIALAPAALDSGRAP